MATYAFPTNAELTVIAQQKMKVLTMDDAIFTHFTIVTKNVDTILWEQKDNFRGLQQIRGINVNPPTVRYDPATNRYAVLPGYYGETSLIDEVMLTRLRPAGVWGSTIEASELVLERQELLLNREIDSYRFTLWNLAKSGTFSRRAPGGQVAHTDKFNTQFFNASNWFNLAAATPLKDLRDLKIKARGKGVSFGRGSTLYLNTPTVNAMLANANPADLGGKVIPNQTGQASGSMLMLADANRVFAANDLPTIAEYDDGHEDEEGVFQVFLGDGEGVLFGRRLDGSPVGEVVQTRNASNPGGAPGPFDAALESPDGEAKMIRVTRIVNWAPTIWYPGAIIRFKCGPQGDYGPIT